MAEPKSLFQDGPRKYNGNGGPPGNEMEFEKRLTAVESAIPTLATKADVGDLRVDFADLRADVANIRTDIHKAISENSRWTHTATVGMFGAFVLGAIGLLFTIWNASKQVPHETPAAQAPIVITVPMPAPSGGTEPRK